MKILFWTIIVKIFGFWNVYYSLKNWKYALICPFSGHKWCTEETFEIQPGGYGFELITCLRCGCNKWNSDNSKEIRN